MPNENTSQRATSASEPAIQPPEAAQTTAPEATAPAEPAIVPSDPIQTPAAVTQTAQVPVDEPLLSQTEPFDSTHDKPITQPAPQQAESPTATAPSAATAVAHAGRDLLEKARATIQDRKRKKLDKILEAISKKGKITNDEVEKLLRVSDATATRDLSTLEKDGRIQQVGKTGKAVAYTRI